MKNLQHEIKDKELFNRISHEYFQKDIYIVSAKARKFQLKSLMGLYLRTTGKNNLGNILELGCGVGASAQYLKGLYNKYTGIDYAENFIEIANQNFSDENNKYVCANIKEFRIEEDKIDFVFGVGVLHHVEGLDSVLDSIRNIGNNETVFGFVEPQATNPIIQIMRRIRMLVDKGYSSEQVFFTKKQIREVFSQNGFKIEAIKYQGYLTPPFAQVIFKPAFIFGPVVALAITIDRFIQNKMNNLFSWNIIWVATKKD